ISLDKEGHILNLEIEKSSIYPSLNTAALDCVKKIDFFPPIPLELGVDKLTFSIPIEYKIL
nr:energy transducer TonB [Bacteriovoracaceae bacterium]